MHVDEDGAQARRMWVRYETFHDVTYFTPESRAAADALGCKGGWMGYFGMRAAPLGAASPAQVVSAFYNFHRSLVGRALPDAWQIASPQQFLDTRLLGTDQGLRRMLGEDTLTGDAMAEAAELAVRAAGFAQIEGRPMAVANAAIALPEQPHLALWQATTVLRESRGDGHVAALVAADLDPVETLITFGAERGLDPAYLRAARGWPEPEWAAGVARLRDRGLLTADEKLTYAGVELRRWVEERTDQAAMRPWRELGATSTARLSELLTPFALRIAEQNEAMSTNPMGLDARSALAD
jgi:hypothetical protein